jgi:hypothetical protein
MACRIVSESSACLSLSTGIRPSPWPVHGIDVEIEHYLVEMPKENRQRGEDRLVEVNRQNSIPWRLRRFSQIVEISLLKRVNKRDTHDGQERRRAGDDGNG